MPVATPYIVVKKWDSTEFYAAYKDMIEGVGISSSVSRNVSEEMRTNLNDTGEIKFNSDAMKALVPTESIRNNLQLAALDVTNGIKIRFIYASEVVLAGLTNIAAAGMVAGGKEIPLAAISETALNFIKNAASGSRALDVVNSLAFCKVFYDNFMKSTIIPDDIKNLDTVIPEYLTSLGNALENRDLDLAAKAISNIKSRMIDKNETYLNNFEAYLQFVANISKPITPASKEDATDSSISYDSFTTIYNFYATGYGAPLLPIRDIRAIPSGLVFNGNVNVEIELAYGQQYTFTETVTFSDGSVYTASGANSIITISQPPGYSSGSAPSNSTLEAIALIAAAKTGNPSVITNLIAAVKQRASIAPAEVNQTMQLVAQATGINLNTNAASVLTVPPAAGACYVQNYVAVSASPTPVTIPDVKIGNSYEFPDGVSVIYAGVLVEVDGNGDLLFDGVVVPEGSIIPGTMVAVTTGLLTLIGPPCNSFPALLQSYRAIRDIYVFRGDSIALLARGEPLPTTTTNRVSWALNGMPAGTLFRDLGRFTVVADATGKHLYLFRNVQWINGADSEGVGGSTADIDEWGTGWICTWADDGIPFCAF